MEPEVVFLWQKNGAYLHAKAASIDEARASLLEKERRPDWRKLIIETAPEAAPTPCDLVMDGPRFRLVPRRRPSPIWSP